MWLPRDERHILLGYYANIFDMKDRSVETYLKEPKWFRSDDWTSVLKCPQWMPLLSLCLIQRQAKRIRAYGDGATPHPEEDILSKKGKQIIAKTAQVLKRLRIANMRLEERKLIEVQPHQSDTRVAGISLTLEGYDLARRCCHWFDRTGLWFREYKDHWVWLIVSFVGGVLGALTVQWLSR